MSVFLPRLLPKVSAATEEGAFSVLCTNIEPPSTMLGKTKTALVLWPTSWADAVLASSFLRPAWALRSISAAVAARAVIGRTVVAPRTKTSAVRRVVLLMGGV